MIIAGWILAILGLAQVVFAGTIEVSGPIGYFRGVRRA